MFGKKCKAGLTARQKPRGQKRVETLRVFFHSVLFLRKKFILFLGLVALLI